MNWFHDVIGWSHISTVLIFSTPFTGFLFATSAGLRSAAPFRLNAHLKVAPAQCVYGFYFLSDFSTMPYYRRPYKRARYGKKLKYSVQQKAVEFSGSDDATAKVEVVPASEIEGMRKVKHLTVSCSAEVDTGLSTGLSCMFLRDYLATSRSTS